MIEPRTAEPLAPGSCRWLPGVETLGELLLARAEAPRADDFRFLFVDEDDLPATFQHRPSGDDLSVTFSYADALAIARRAAHVLAREGVEKGDRVLLVLPTGPGFLAA